MGNSVSASTPSRSAARSMRASATCEAISRTTAGSALLPSAPCPARMESACCSSRTCAQRPVQAAG